jgi:hypothetical protein
MLIVDIRARATKIYSDVGPGVIIICSCMQAGVVGGGVAYGVALPPIVCVCAPLLGKAYEHA